MSKSNIVINGIDHYGISARDVAESVAFYVGVLGFTESRSPAPNITQLTCGTNDLAISPLSPADAAPSHAAGDHIAFRVAASVDVAEAELTRMNIHHERVKNRIYLRDPDGYIIELVCQA